MNKVITVNLNGNAYQLEESGYDALRVYLDGAAQRLASNPDRDEIIADIEQAIADKFRAVLGKFKSVVESKVVLAIIAEMGPVQDDASTDPSTDGSAPRSTSAGDSKASRPDSSTSNAGASGEPARRLYKIPEGAMIAGVCNGIAAYFNLDVIIVRLGFLAASLAIGLIALLVHWIFILPVAAYIALALLLPSANTAAERAAARGDPATAEEYIRRAKQGYYAGLKTFAAATNHKDWKRKYKQEMRAAYQGRHYEYPGWSRSAAPAFVLPLIGFFEFGVLILWLLGLVSLVSKGNVLGLSLPDGVPLWIGIVAMAFALNLLLWPLKALKRGCYVGVTGDYDCPCHGGFVSSFVWLAVFVASVWLADHYIPAVHEFILTLPPKIDATATAIQDWWKHRQ